MRTLSKKPSILSKILLNGFTTVPTTFLIPFPSPLSNFFSLDLARSFSFFLLAASAAFSSAFLSFCNVLIISSRPCSTEASSAASSRPLSFSARSLFCCLSIFFYSCYFFCIYFYSFIMILCSNFNIIYFDASSS